MYVCLLVSQKVAMHKHTREEKRAISSSVIENPVLGHLAFNLIFSVKILLWYQ